MGNFFGDLAKGLATGVQIGTQMQANQQAYEDYKQKKKERDENNAYQAALKAAGQGGTVATTDHLDAPFASQDDAEKDIGVQKGTDTPSLAPQSDPSAIAAALPANPLKSTAPAPPPAAAPPQPSAPVQQAALPTPQSPPPAMTTPQAGPAAQAPQLVPVQDPITHRWGVVDKAQTRPMTDIEIAERQAAVARAYGKNDDAARILDNAYKLNSDKIAAQQQQLLTNLSQGFLMGVPGINAVLDKDFNANNPVGVRVNVVPVDGGYALRVTQPGSGVPDSFIGPDGPSQTPVPISGQELPVFLTGVVKNDLPGAMRDISELRSSIQSRQIAAAQEGRAKESFPIQLDTAKTQLAAAKLGLKGDQITLLAKGDLSGLSDDQLLNFIASNEEGPNGYNAVYGDQANGTRMNGINMPANLTNMTLGQITDMQPAITAATARAGVAGGRGTSAVGRYQFVRDTLMQTAQKVFGANWRNVQFTPANQDKMALALADSVGRTAQGLGGQWEGVANFYANGGISPKVNALQTAAANDKARAQYITTMAGKLIDQGITPGTPQWDAAMTVIANQAPSTAGPSSTAPTKNFTTQGQPQPRVALPKQAQSPQQSALNQIEADIKHRIGMAGPLQMPEISAEFKQDYGMSIEQAKADPVKALANRRAIIQRAQNAPGILRTPATRSGDGSYRTSAFQ